MSGSDMFCFCPLLTILSSPSSPKLDPAGAILYQIRQWRLSLTSRRPRALADLMVTFRLGRTWKDTTFPRLVVGR